MGFGKDGRGVILKSNDPNDSIASLGNQTVQKLACPGFTNITEDFRLLKLVAQLSVINLANDESLVIGLADNELSASEIKESLEAQGPLDRADRDSEEKATRPVWPLGQIIPFQSGSVATMAFEWKKRWTFSDGTGFVLFVYNPSNSSLSASTQTVRHVSTAYGVWVT